MGSVVAPSAFAVGMLRKKNSFPFWATQVCYASADGANDCDSSSHLHMPPLASIQHRTVVIDPPTSHAEWRALAADLVSRCTCDGSDVLRRWSCDELASFERFAALAPIDRLVAVRHGLPHGRHTAFRPAYDHGVGGVDADVRATALRCLRGIRRIVFVGSSRTRHLYIDFAKLLLDGKPSEPTSADQARFSFLNDTVVQPDLGFPVQSNEHRRITVRCAVSDQGDTDVLLEFLQIYTLSSPRAQERIFEAITI